MPPPLSSSTTLKRIQREIADLKKEDLGDITLGPSGDNLFLWKATLPGPEGSVYEGGVFEVEINLPHDYPFSAPRMTFRTRIYHMNISDRGGICIDILKHNWSPALSLFKVILSLSSLLTDPNPKDPLVPSIATEYIRNRKQHDNTARQWTQQYARPPPPPPVTSPSASGSTTRSKGKSVAVLSAPNSRAGSSRPASSATPEPIIIEDSEDEGKASHRPSKSTTKRKRDQSSDNPINQSNEERSSPPTRRRRVSGEGVHEVDGVIVID
ncbi:ubiquitin-conjugating enzyme/RWD-like protein [Abortiporus biennis]|nr:ubiquitin-conjugating enzyme/RWD-like protein [Abortiporus biennis]